MRGLKARKLRRYILKGRFLRDGSFLVIGFLLVIAAVILGVINLSGVRMTQHIDQAKYAQLLDVIAEGESKGNYNAYFGHAANTNIRFTEMTVGQVLQWQEDHVQEGGRSSAVGKYQIIRPTLEGLVHERGIDKQEKYDEALQDKLAIALLERRGAHDFVSKKLAREEFAANLAKEWAALPKVTGPNPEQSYYAGDGLNKVQVSIAEVYKALDTLQS